jgi:hypothetical protein
MTVYKPGDNDDQLWRDTDYTVADVEQLIFSGHIPSIFINVLPTGNTEVSSAVYRAMKHFPKKDFVGQGMNPLGGILTVLHKLAEDEALSLDDEWKGNASMVPVKGNYGLVEMTYHNAEELGVLVEVEPAKVQRLLHWVHTQNPALDQWIINDPKEGYMVAYPFIRAFLTEKVDFVQFLKGLVTGRIRIVRDEDAE